MNVRYRPKGSFSKVLESAEPKSQELRQTFKVKE